MRDARISLPRVQQLHPTLINQVVEIINKVEINFPKTIQVRVTATFRTFAEQDALFRKRPKVSNSRGGQSYHNYRLAFDFVLMYDLNGDGNYETVSWDTLKDFDRDGQADWMEVVNAFKAAGWEWGGDFRSLPDSPHLQFTYNKHWRELLAMHNAKKFIPKTQFLKLP